MYSEAQTRGINETYPSAYANGSAGVLSYNQGQAAGQAKGSTDGKAQADRDGFKQGCIEGKALGSASVHNGGDPRFNLTCDTAADILGVSRRTKNPVVTPQDQDRCYQSAYTSVVGSIAATEQTHLLLQNTQTSNTKAGCKMDKTVLIQLILEQ